MTTKQKTNPIIEETDKALKALSGMVERLKKQVSDDLPVLQVLEPMPYIPSVGKSDFRVKQFYGGYQDCTTVQQLENVKKTLEEKYKSLLTDIENVHNTNIPRIENNKLLREKITLMMTAVGISPTWSQYEIPKGKRTKQWITHLAGYDEDLRRNVKIDDGYAVAARSVDSCLKDIDRIFNELKAGIAKEEQKKLAEEKERAKTLWLAKMQVKYSLDETASIEDVLSTILSKDKYLDLAHAMMETRNDWSDGFYRVVDALGRFSVTTEEDQKIYNCVNALTEDDYDADGRVFRDCAWSYDVIFQLVLDKQLLEDYSKACSYKAY